MCAQHGEKCNFNEGSSDGIRSTRLAFRHVTSAGASESFSKSMHHHAEHGTTHSVCVCAAQRYMHLADNAFHVIVRYPLFLVNGFHIHMRQRFYFHYSLHRERGALRKCLSLLLCAPVCPCPASPAVNASLAHSISMRVQAFQFFVF